MGSVSSVNPGLVNLFQTLSAVGSPVMSSQADMNALEKAPPTDIVELSAMASQLEAVDAMFGITPQTSTTDPLANLFGSSL